jgi:hypothetical protein
MHSLDWYSSRMDCGICKKLLSQEIDSKCEGVGDWESPTNSRAHRFCLEVIRDCEKEFVEKINRSIKNPTDRRWVHIVAVKEIEKETHSTIMEICRVQGRDKLRDLFNAFGTQSISNLIKKRETEAAHIRKWSKL